MYFIKDLIDMVWNVIKSMDFRDIVDILILTYLVCICIKFFRETRAWSLIKGVILFSALYFLCSQLELKAVSYILAKTFSVGLIAIAIVFQPELRRALERFGQAGENVFQLGDSSAESVARWHLAINMISDACEELSATTTGALIVIERRTRLGEQVETGTIIDSKPSRELLCNIFYPKTPLHDGAVIVRDGMLLAAACFLPKPQKEELINKQLGSRHRAAIGMSENSDAIVVVVSEETGTISVAERGELKRDFDKETLKRHLRERLSAELTENKSTTKKKRSERGDS